MRLANMPIFITEFGIKNPKDFQEKCLLKAAVVIGSHPEIKGVSYFNLSDNPKVWGTFQLRIGASARKHFSVL